MANASDRGPGVEDSKKGQGDRTRLDRAATTGTDACPGQDLYL